MRKHKQQQQKNGPTRVDDLRRDQWLAQTTSRVPSPRSEAIRRSYSQGMDLPTVCVRYGVSPDLALAILGLRKNEVLAEYYQAEARWIDAADPMRNEVRQDRGRGFASDACDNPLWGRRSR